jgi:hypothetical protein
MRYIQAGHYGKTRIIDEGRLHRPMDKWIPIDVPDLKIIELETFYADAERSKRNKELAKRNRKNEYLLSGFFRCGACGATTTGHYRTYES